MSRQPSIQPSMEEETPKAAKKRSSSTVLGGLREAISKVRFLLSFSATRWMLLRSLAGRGGAPARRLSFDSRPGLLDVDGGFIASPSSSSSSSNSRITSRSASLGTATTRSLSRTSSAASPEALKRASSSSSGGSSPAAAAGDDDIDQRAELFIANFYRQLRMERQVSLQLRYVGGNSWDRTPAASPSPSPSPYRG